MKKLLLMFFFLLSLKAASQFPSGRILHYTRKEGLSYGAVNSILQDNKGFMWFATGDGLNRFDGVDFKIFKYDPEQQFSLPSNYVQKIFKDSHGKFWISSRKGLYQFNPKTEAFENDPRFSVAKKADVSHIMENKAGNLWVSTSGNGFSFLDGKTGKSINYLMKNLKGLTSNSILKIYEDAYGLLWVGTRDAGICVFRVNNGKILGKVNFDAAINKASRVNCIYSDHHSNIWIATSAGLWLFDRTAKSFHKLEGKNYGLSSNVFLSLVQDSQEKLFIGLQDGGLYQLDLSHRAEQTPGNMVFEQLKYENGFNITPRSVPELYLDKEENLWVGTYGDGIFMISRTADKFKWFHKKVKDNFGENYLRYYGMCMDDEGYLWLGTDGDGIYKTKPNGEVVKKYRAGAGKNSLAENAVLYGYKDSKNNLWFGTYSKGLSLYDRKSDAFINFRHDDKVAGSLGGNDVRVIHEDNQHNIWVGTNGGGLNRLNLSTNKFTVYNTANSKISSNDVRSLAHDSKGNIWVGTYGGGLNYFNTAEQKFYSFSQVKKQVVDLSREIIFALYLDAQKRLWIGTEGNGLLVYDTEKQSSRRFSEKNGLANNTVYAIQEEEPGKIWVSTNDGLSKVALQQHKIYNYNEKDGLQGGQFNPGSSISGKQGNFICFGGTEGWNLFYPKQIVQSSGEPEIRITGLQLYGNGEDEKSDSKNISESGHIVLEADESVFSIQYVALNYAYPRAAQFAYKLDGLDKDWNYVKYQKSATYRYLEPGYYTFKVKATNQDNIWQSSYATLRIEVLPPWYRTWWAYTVYLLITAGVIYLLVQYKSNQAKLKYTISIARIEAQKEKELHENKLSFFTNISHEFRTPLTLIINPVREILDDKKQEADLGSLTIVYRNAKRLLSLVDQLLLFSKAETDADKLKIVYLQLFDLCQEVFLCFTHLAAKKNISYEFITSAEDICIYGDREKVEIALFNLISNAIRHTHEGGRVVLSLDEDKAAVYIKVADTGTGIDPQVGDRIYERFYKVQNNKNYAKGGFGVGLYLVKNFIERHQGKVSYTSSLTAGTIFSLTLLKGHAHFSDAPIFDDQPESSVILEELREERDDLDTSPDLLAPGSDVKEDISSEIKTILVIDDNQQIREYIVQLFRANFQMLEADNGETGLEMVRQYLPDMVISDVLMPGLNGVELCRLVKQDPSLYHIPVVLLTASTSSESKLRGIECGADDYISKPFEKEILIARIEGLLKNRNELQKYFYNEITLRSGNLKISAEYKEFLDRCIAIVEAHMTDPNFSIQMLAEEIGMSRSNLYTRIKSISGQSANSFIRFIRLRKAAEIFISTELTVQETTFRVGIKDARYFREQFFKVFQMNPSDYIKKYRKNFNGRYSLNKSLIRSKDPK